MRVSNFHLWSETMSEIWISWGSLVYASLLFLSVNETSFQPSGGGELEFLAMICLFWSCDCDPAVDPGSGFSDPIHFHCSVVWHVFHYLHFVAASLKTDCSDQREEPTISTKHSTKMFIYELFWGTDCFSFVLHVLFCPFDSVEVWKPRAHGRYRH